MVSWGRILWVVVGLVGGLLILVGTMVILPAMAESTSGMGDGAKLAGPPIVINEVAWAGTAASSFDEWIELYNRTDQAVVVDGWWLEIQSDGSTLLLAGTIAPGGFYLIEADDDTPISDIPADLIAGFRLLDTNEGLVLYDSTGQPVDSANGDGGEWPGGIGGPMPRSMERVDPHRSDGDGNWGTNDGVICNGFDARWHQILGTPTAWNSAGVTADLGIEKSGPFAVAPGAELTYTLTFANHGALTATGVVITDILPSVVEYVRSDAPYTLTEPVSGTLVWQVGTVAPEDGAMEFPLLVRLVPGWTGSITNTASISSSTIERQGGDNRADWVVRVDDSGPFANLEMIKGGPARVATGGRITYSLTIANHGEVTATGVVVSDVLPAGVGYISDSSPYPLTRPEPEVLRWEVGTLGSREVAPAWTLVGWVTDTISGTLTNEAWASSRTPEANPADNRARVTTVAVYTPTVRLTAVHYHALEGYDEAVQIANLTGIGVQVGGWTVGDGSTVVTLPPTVKLGGRQAIWLAQQAAAFRTQFGFDPDFERLESDPDVPNLGGSWPGFANVGDEVILADGSGVTQDVLVYGEGDTTQAGWIGAAVWPYERGGLAGEGQILYRKWDEVSGRPVADTDRAADWAQDVDDPATGRRVRYPGWDLDRFFRPVQVTETAKLTVVVGPEATYSTTVQVVMGANESVLVATTALESTGLAQAIAARAAAGVSATVLLEGDPVGGVSDQMRWACQEIEDVGGQCLLMVDDPDRGIWDRYADQAAQIILIDGRWAVIGSASMNTEAMPEDEKANGTAGGRSVMLITDAPAVVSRLTRLYELDADPVNHRDVVTSEAIGPPPDGYVPIETPDWITYSSRFVVPWVAEGEMGFEMVQAPESSLRQRDGLLGLLARAGQGDTVLVEQSMEPAHWGDGGSTWVEDPNLRLEAYLAAAERGASVRLLLDGDDRDPARRAQNVETCAYVQQRAREEQLSILCALANPTGLGISNQMVLAEIDGRGIIHLGSIVGTERANKESRGVALQVQSDEAYVYLARVFERDWPHPVYLPVALRTYPGSADHLLISEVLYDPVGVDDGQEWVELTNPRAEGVELAGWMVGDAAEADHREGLYLFPPGAWIGAYETVVIAADGAQFAAEYGFEPDYELTDTLPGVPDLMGHPTWGRGKMVLSNTGDEVLLLDGVGRPVDVVVWGAGSYPGVVPHPGGTGEGRTLERYPRWVDSDDCRADWRVQAIPNPGTVP